MSQLEHCESLCRSLSRVCCKFSPMTFSSDFTEIFTLLYFTSSFPWIAHRCRRLHRQNLIVFDWIKLNLFSLHFHFLLLFLYFFTFLASFMTRNQAHVPFRLAYLRASAFSCKICVGKLRKTALWNVFLLSFRVIPSCVMPRRWWRQARNSCHILPLLCLFFFQYKGKCL